MVEISVLYTHLNTLTKQWFYDKDEIDNELSDVVRTSSTEGLLKNDGTVDTTSYQEAGDYIETSQTAGLVKNDGTIDTTSYQEAGDYIETSQTAGLVKNDGTIDTTSYADSTTLATVATSGSYADLENIPSTFAPTAHEHSAADVSDSSAYTNLGTSANATQHAINTAIDTKIGALLSVDLIQVESTLPTASASTMNKLYLVPEASSKTHDSYEIYVTVETDNEGTPAYDWEKVDTARIDLSGKADVSHTHGNLTNDGKIGSNANYFVTTTTGGAVTSQEKIGNITTAGAIGSASGKLAVTTTDGVLTTSDMVSEMDTTVQALIAYGQSLNNS